MFRLRNNFALTHHLLVFIFMCVCGVMYVFPCVQVHIHVCVFGLVVQEHHIMYSTLFTEAI